MHIVVLGLSWANVGNMVLVAIALGAVIFVHELGHFVVAKLCGVKCEKFYIGFDVPLKFGPIRLPSTFWKKKWGETEYGIGVLPLGGYVKMLGQDDNPAKLAEEMQRAQTEAGDESETKEITGPGGERYRVHRRSYLAKSVPQRMTIISAGVVMNLIFAFLFAVVAYGLGVPYMPCIVSETSPGSPAWEANLAVGDEIVQIGDRKDPSFSDLRGKVTLGNLETGVAIRVKGPDETEPRSITLKPRQGKGLATIGIISPRSLRLHKEKPVVPYSPAGHATLVSGSAGSADASRSGASGEPTESEPVAEGGQGTGFHGEDEIVAVDGQPVTTWRELSSILARKRGESIDVTVRRGGMAPKENPFAPRTGGRELTFSVEPRRMKQIGLVMQIGKVVAVQNGSPAAKADNQGSAPAGVLPGDFLQEMNGEPIGDPVTWPDRVRRLAEKGEWVTLTVTRTSEAGEDVTKVIDDIMPRVPDWIELATLPNTPMPCAALGVAYRVLNRVDRVLPGSPAEKAGLRSGDVIVSAKILVSDQYAEIGPDEPIEFGDDAQNWPMFVNLMQLLPPDTDIELSVKRREEQLSLTMRAKAVAPTESDETESEEIAYYPSRGFVLLPVQRIRKADSFGEQVEMGWDKTVDSLMLVFRFLGKIGGQVPIRALGGPVEIAKASYYSASEGYGKLLVFLTLLSANLAVINFLPIPILDGGHMVFLAFEGIVGRPPREKFVIALHMIGFAFIISLMLFVFALDLGFISRNL